MPGVPDPVITGPTGDIWENNNVMLHCTSPVNNMIHWSRRDSIALNAPVFEITGNMFSSTLIINNAREDHSGVYVCRVGESITHYDLTVSQSKVLAKTFLP